MCHIFAWPTVRIPQRCRPGGAATGPGPDRLSAARRRVGGRSPPPTPPEVAAPAPDRAERVAPGAGFRPGPPGPPLPPGRAHGPPPRTATHAAAWADEQGEVGVRVQAPFPDRQEDGAPEGVGVG